jgi:hypothetical protein
MTLSDMIRMAIEDAGARIGYDGVPLLETSKYPPSLVHWKEAPRLIKAFKNYTKKAVTYLLAGLMNDLIQKELSGSLLLQRFVLFAIKELC